jgi:probable addiction module antidote protein
MSQNNELMLAPFDASDYLNSEETIAGYLRAALENPDPDAFLTAARDVAKARGISRVAAEAGLGRESLYKALKPGAHPVSTPCGGCSAPWGSGWISPHLTCIPEAERVARRMGRARRMGFASL